MWIGCSRRLLFRCADQAVSSHDNLQRHSPGFRRRWSNSTRKLPVKLVERHVAAIERLQHQDLPDRGWASIDAAPRTTARHRGGTASHSPASCQPAHAAAQYRSHWIPGRRLPMRMISPRVRSTSWAIVIVLALLWTAVSAEAQLRGQFAGTISDQTGAPLPGVRVTIRGVIVRTTQTSAVGEFALPAFLTATMRSQRT
jgi:hypothetical protein